MDAGISTMFLVMLERGYKVSKSEGLSRTSILELELTFEEAISIFNKLHISLKTGLEPISNICHRF